MNPIELGHVSAETKGFQVRLSEIGSPPDNKQDAQ